MYACLLYFPKEEDTLLANNATLDSINVICKDLKKWFASLALKCDLFCTVVVHYTVIDLSKIH
jgi:hypothetical protein